MRQRMTRRETAAYLRSTEGSGGMTAPKDGKTVIATDELPRWFRSLGQIGRATK